VLAGLAYQKEIFEFSGIFERAYVSVVNGDLPIENRELNLGIWSNYTFFH